MLKKSPFAVEVPVIPQINGIEIKTCCTGMRYKKDDLLFVSFPEKANVAGIFTKTSLPGEPVLWNKSILSKGFASGLIVNSGYANVLCGKKGKKTIKVTSQKAAKILNCDEDEIYIASTGVIGEPVKDKFLIKALEENLQAADFDKACTAINTTDTFNKSAYIETEISGKKVKIAGIIKGSGMVEPNMATMLGFIFTDAKIPSQILQQLLNEVKDKTYNIITVDSDSSTSDMVLAFATGKADNAEISNIEDEEFQAFRKAFLDINLQLAKLVVKDGEGISKFIEIKVEQAESEEAAIKIAKSIANSPLVKTAIAGEDANWGRIIMAVGKSGEKVNKEKINIFLGNLQPLTNGGLNENYNEAQASEYMKESEIKIKVQLGIGDSSATIYTSDLTHDYISINADYRS